MTRHWSPLVLAATAGVVVALWRRRRREADWLAAWRDAEYWR